MMKRQSPDTPVELMVVANSIPEERRLACEKHDINCLVISEKKYRDVATEVGYEITSEKDGPTREASVPDAANGDHRVVRRGAPSKIEKSWGWHEADGKSYVLAFVNAKGSCSVRTFDHDGYFMSREYGSGDFQVAFQDRYKLANSIALSHQLNLEQTCRTRLPDWVLTEIRKQVSASKLIDAA